MVIGQNYKYKRKKQFQPNSQTSGYGKRLLITVETGVGRLEKVIFSGSCPIEGGDEVKIIAYEGKVMLQHDKYYEAKEIHKIRQGKTSRVDYSTKENA